jgi:hypothetical protein
MYIVQLLQTRTSHRLKHSQNPVGLIINLLIVQLLDTLYFRKTYNCDTNDVIQAIMKALLILPNQLIPARKNFKVYKAKLDEVGCCLANRYIGLGYNKSLLLVICINRLLTAVQWFVYWDSLSFCLVGSAFLYKNNNYFGCCCVCLCRCCAST